MVVGVVRGINISLRFLRVLILCGLFGIYFNSSAVAQSHQRVSEISVESQAVLKRFNDEQKQVVNSYLKKHKAVSRQLNPNLVIYGESESGAYIQLKELNGENFPIATPEFSLGIDPYLVPAPSTGVDDDVVAEAEDVAESQSVSSKSANALVEYIKYSAAKKECDQAIKVLFSSLRNFEEYMDDCDVRRFKGSNGDFNQASLIAEKIGVFVDKETRLVECGGYQLTENIILTARHCNFEGKLTYKKYRFVFFDTSKPIIDSYQVDDSACAGIHINHQRKSYQPCDYIKLVLESSVEYRDTIKVANSLSHYSRIRFVGYHKLAHAISAGKKPIDIERGEQSLKTNLNSWREGMVWSANPLCVAHEIKEANLSFGENKTYRNKCFFHSCQTYRGMSGTPMFQENEKQELELVGLHIGTNFFDEKKWVAKQPCGFEAEQVTYQNVKNLAITYSSD
jgi:hypothetical protein